jgi:hypothetical protein
MVVPINDVVVLVILTIIHILAIIFTVKVGKAFNSKSWNFIIVAFILLLLRRIWSFLEIFDITPYSGDLILLIDRIYLPLIFWVLIGLGMIRIYYRIKSSMEIERKIKSIGKKKKR